MGAIDIKTELQQMIEKETDINILKAIRVILQKTSIDPALKDKLTSRALKSEEDIRTGRLYTPEEVVSLTDRILN